MGTAAASVSPASVPLLASLASRSSTVIGEDWWIPRLDHTLWPTRT
jgi:hypothetical protein